MSGTLSYYDFVAANPNMKQKELQQAWRLYKTSLVAAKGEAVVESPPAAPAKRFTLLPGFIAIVDGVEIRGDSKADLFGQLAALGVL